jgi:predicted  nucleic acid-binding Zn-ribbon protein
LDSGKDYWATIAKQQLVTEEQWVCNNCGMHFSTEPSVCPDCNISEFKRIDRDPENSSNSSTKENNSSKSTHPIKPHLLEEEEIKESLKDNRWLWVATTERVIKYQKNSNKEEMHDISYDQIGGLSLQTENRGEGLVTFGLALILLLVDNIFIGIVEILSIVASSVGFINELEIIVLSIIIGIGAIYIGINLETTYFQLRGTGLLEKEAERWRINSTDSEDAREFVKAIRSQIN